MIKSLVISNPFLINKSPAGLLLRYFFNEVSKHNVSPFVICSRNGDIQWGKSNVKVLKTKESIFIKDIFALIRRFFFRFVVFA